MQKIKQIFNNIIEKIKKLDKKQRTIGIITIVVIIGLAGFGIYRYCDHQAYVNLVKAEENHEEELKETIKESLIFRATFKYDTKISDLQITKYQKSGINYYVEGYVIVNGKKKNFDAKFVASGSKNNGHFDYMDYANWDN